MGMPLSMDMSMMADHMAGTTKVDRMFLEMMIPHHSAAISMAQEEKDRGSDAELIRMAGILISSQARDIARMQDILDRPVY